MVLHFKVRKMIIYTIWILLLNKKMRRLMKNFKEIMHKKLMKKGHHQIVTLTLVFWGLQMYQLTVMSIPIYVT